jgi:beta-glucosidase
VSWMDGARTEFTWGVATSAYQIEGAWNEDGKSESIWDRMAHSPEMSDTGDTACDHYHRLEEDLDLLQEMGVDAYRFSVAWARVLPSGVGDVNEPGMQFYERLVDGLLERGIEPWLTLFHWDLPQALQDRGGLVSDQFPGWFSSYAEIVARRLGDRVRHWITINEPWVAAFAGHQIGVHAPGLQDWPSALAAGHHLLVGHGRATTAIRGIVPEAKVGIALDCRQVNAASQSSRDIAAARHFDGYRNRWFFDPVFGKGYPQDMLDAYTAAGRIPENLIKDGDLDEISVSTDFCGLNFYTSVVIGAGSQEAEPEAGQVGIPPTPGHTEKGWLIDPDALGTFLRRMQADWDVNQICITENGMALSTGPDQDGRVRDQERIDFTAAHLDVIEGAIDAGIPVTAYFAWSFMDNLEWRSGFSQRFGMVYVDHETQKRTLKDSALWYRDEVINRDPIDD